MLRQRLVAAVLGLPIIIVLIALNWWARAKWGSPDDLPILFMTLLIAGASGWELSAAIRQRHPGTAKWNGVYAAVILPLLVHSVREVLPGNLHAPVNSLGLLIDALGSTAAFMLLFLGVWSDIEQRGREGIRENVRVLGGGLYLGVCLSTALLSSQTPLHEGGAALLFVLVFGVDTFAYFGGMTFRGPLLAPHLSPKKTVSGAIVGLLCAIVLALLFHLKPVRDAFNAERDLTVIQLVIIGTGIGVLGQVGDLLESWFKRWAGVKDSGAAIPGHGGFLDRFDSLFLAAPFCYAMLSIFLRH